MASNKGGHADLFPKITDEAVRSRLSQHEYPR
jgi:hypothetical protein